MNRFYKVKAVCARNEKSFSIKSKKERGNKNDLY